MKLIVLISLLFAGCHQDPNQTILQYVPDMADAPTIKPQESFLNPPDGSVAMNTLIYPQTIEEMEKHFVMPPRIAKDPQVNAKGKVMFETFCAVCHGQDAKGKGTLTPDFPVPPDLTHQVYQDKKDGFFFYRITFGATLMPSYGYAISPVERWYIISYLRSLQGKG